MSYWSKIFSCCQKISYINNKEIYMNNTNNQKQEQEPEKENEEEKNKNNNINLQNILLNQTNLELYHNLLKNNINTENQNLSKNNINILNLDNTQNISNNPEEYNIFPNKIINNNIINNNIIKITNNNNFLNMNQKELGYISFCGQQSNLDKSCLNSKTKNLELSGTLFFNQKIIITQNGLENSLRKMNKFPIYFGTEANVDKNGLPYNDYIVNYKPKKKLKKKKTNNSIKENNKENRENEIEEEIQDEGRLKRRRLFKIIYDKNKNEYILNFMHNSLILYYKINNIIYFDYDKEYYFILGNVFLSIIIKQMNEKKNISIRVETEEQKAEKANFENIKKLVIGRCDSCDMEIDRQCISKIHSIIEYDNNINHYYYKDNNSTNGSTLLIREEDSITIKGIMFFKLEDTPFIIKEIE